MIRAIQKSDYGPIIRLVQSSFSPSRYESNLVNFMFEHNESIGWVHEENEAILGVVLYSAARKDSTPIGWHLAPLAVDPLHQKKGIGSTLILESLQSEQLSSSSVFVLGNPAFYTRFGFQLIPNPSCIYDPGNKHFMALRWNDITETFPVGYCSSFQRADALEAGKDSSSYNSSDSNNAAKVDIEGYKTAAANELVAVVDRGNNVIGSAKRSEMRRDRLIHRATFAFVKNSKNMFYVQKRSMLKDYCPGYFDATPGGVVASGETYAETNAREMEEEMGIPTSTHMEHLFTFYFEDERARCFGDSWAATYDGALTLQATEVDAVELMSMEDILQRAENGEKFTPDSIVACKEYVRLFGMPVVAP